MISFILGFLTALGIELGIALAVLTLMVIGAKVKGRSKGNNEKPDSSDEYYSWDSEVD